MPPASGSLLFTWSLESVLIGLALLSLASYPVEVWNSYPLPVPRRYTVEGVPMRKTVHWTVNLTKQAGDRSRGQTFNRTVS